MIAGVGQYSPVFARCERPVSSVSSPQVGPTDSVQVSAPPVVSKRPARGFARTALNSAANACKGALFGPVAHYAGKAAAALGKTPAPRKPNIPPSELGPLPHATLKRPIVFVAGWHTRPDRFGPVTEKLTENGSNGGAVGYIKSGKVYSDPHCTAELTAPPKDMKVFVSLLESASTAPDDAQPEFAQNLQTIQRLTDGATMDMMPFSMGGLETRVWIDQHEHPNMGKVLFLATPHQGAGLAGLSHHLLEGKNRGWDTDWLLGIKQVTQEDKGSLEWLRPHSDKREDLNSRWPLQKSRVEDVLCLGSNGKKTVGTHGLLRRGDGMVPEQSLKLEDTAVEVLDEKCAHGELIQSPQVYTRMLSFFDWA